MKKISYIAYALVVSAVMTGCADYVDTSDFKVEKPESVSKYDYLKDYQTLNNYVDNAARPNFKLGAAVSATEYLKRSSIYALVSSNFNMLTPTSEMMHGSNVDASGILNLEPVRKLALYASEVGTDVYGHALVSNTQQNNGWLNALEANAVAMLGPEDKIVDSHVDYSEVSAFPYTLINNFAPKVTDGVLVANITNKKHQFYLVENMPTIPGMKYEVTIRIKGSRDANLTLQIGGKDYTIKFPVYTDWTDSYVEFTAPGESISLIVDPGNIKINTEIQYVDIRHQRPLTAAEKLALYTDELERWISGLMEATKGTVTTWELVNCPIADSGDNGEGYYPLMNSENGPKNNFYWCEPIGDIDFVKIPAGYAQKYFTEFEGNAADLKLYVNENCVADSHKAESLVYWVKKWEGAGVKIDGIGTEMHLTCDADASALAEQKALVTKNLEILAATGKLVRITALEAAYNDAEGKKVATADMTPEQLKELGEFYKWVVKTYMDKVPAAQQGGICLWTIVDGTNAGLWTEAYDRTTLYGAFADALQGK